MQPIASGINAVSGTAIGRAVFSPIRIAKFSDPVILICEETNPDYIGAMNKAEGILTATGGHTSHAAIIARGWGKPCVVGCQSLNIGSNKMTVNGNIISEGDWISLQNGNVFLGRVESNDAETSETGFLDFFLKCCDSHRKMDVRANADMPTDAAKAFLLGASGIGLVRTEHMFFSTERRRLAIQRFILGDESVLYDIRLFQEEDFASLFRVANGRPVTIRLIDPPLHEFMPRDDAQVQKLANASNKSVADIRRAVQGLVESNPMLGCRGCRLAFVRPSILECQVSAIVNAALTVQDEGIAVNPEIMVPFIIDPNEFSVLVTRIRQAIKLVDTDGKIGVLIGTMIETPRAALLAGQLAKVADFFSFGTNDLTQMTLALSRDDAGRFADAYKGFIGDPFETIDVAGVGLLMQSAIDKARKVNPSIKIGVCGEHGADPASIVFFQSIGVHYVSCSPLRVPMARFGGAKASMKSDAKRSKKNRSKKSRKNSE